MGLQLWRGAVLPEWLDYNGHMTEHRYLQAFGESSDALYERIGVDFARASEGAFFTLETHLRHIAEAKLGAGLFSETDILAYDDKRLHLFHRLLDADGKLLATGEHLTIHVRHGKVAVAAEAMLRRIAEIFALNADDPLPEGVGSVLRRPLALARLAG
jgi:acyl-CoA thioester hydrolase